uniref:Uncharacterized protein n=1 Tax=Fagus sylvatica TaxID=28930 RepID=A0A2N9J6M8_FAGSY
MVTKLGNLIEHATDSIRKSLAFVSLRKIIEGFLALDKRPEGTNCRGVVDSLTVPTQDPHEAGGRGLVMPTSSEKLSEQKERLIEPSSVESKFTASELELLDLRV